MVHKDMCLFSSHFSQLFLFSFFLHVLRSSAPSSLLKSCTKLLVPLESADVTENLQFQCVATTNIRNTLLSVSDLFDKSVLFFHGPTRENTHITGTRGMKKSAVQRVTKKKVRG